MTIYTKPTGEKKSEKAPDASKEPLTGKDDADCEEGAPKVVRVTYSPRHRRTWVNLCLILTALLVLGTGIIAAIFLYRHLSSKIWPDCIDTEYLEEDVEVSEVELYERFTVPKFDEVEETVNLTAIVDPTHHTCYVMPLNRTRIAPPHDLIDLIMKLKTRYYMPKASVVREEYRVVLPPLSDLTVLGSYIMRECYFYYTFRLEKYVSGVYKRSVDQGAPAMEEAGHYAFIAYTPGHHELFKFTIFKEQEKKDQ
nr:hypothetical protein BaRGS_029529 [Batillaria attramentaria]